MDEGEEVMRDQGFSSAVKQKLLDLEYEDAFPLTLAGERDRIFNLLRQKYPVLK
jgi:hypothetical protein